MIGNNAGFETGTTQGWVVIRGLMGGGLPGQCHGICPTFQNDFWSTGAKINANGNNADLNTGVDPHTIVDVNCLCNRL